MRPGSARPGSARMRPTSARTRQPQSGASPSPAVNPNATPTVQSPATPGIGAQPGSAPVGTRMHVSVRIRPFTQADLGDSTEAVMVDPEDNRGVLVLDEARRPRRFAFDEVFHGPQSQEMLFNSLGLPMLEETYKGFNVCLFAYGQTGSGKTYSIQGEAEEGNAGEGLVPRFVRELFRQAQAKVESDPELSIRVSMSYIEIYMEKVRDLLVPRSGKKDQEPDSLELREDPSRRVYVQDLGVHSVLSVDRVMELLKRGNANRQKAETKMNELSSRSHSILQFTVLQTCESGERRDVVSDIRLVDLAGSERQSKSEASGLQLEEAKKINHSLLMLGRALNCFSEGRTNEFLSLRESKLTRLLSDCFGGNSKTWMLATISPAASNCTESLSTLEYATNAKRITSRAVINKVARVLELKELKETVSRMEAAIEGERAKAQTLTAENEALEQQLSELQEKLQFHEANEIRSRLSTTEQLYARLIEENDSLRQEERLLAERLAFAEAQKGISDVDAGESRSCDGEDAEVGFLFNLQDLDITYSGVAGLSLKDLMEKKALVLSLVLNDVTNPAPSQGPAGVSQSASGSPRGLAHTGRSSGQLGSGFFRLSSTLTGFPSSESLRQSTAGTAVSPDSLSLLDVQVELELLKVGETGMDPEQGLDWSHSMPKTWFGKDVVKITIKVNSVENAPARVTTAMDVAFWFKKQEHNIMTSEIAPLRSTADDEGKGIPLNKPTFGAEFDFQQDMILGPSCASLTELLQAEDVLTFHVRGYSARETSAPLSSRTPTAAE